MEHHQGKTDGSDYKNLFRATTSSTTSRRGERSPREDRYATIRSVREQDTGYTYDQVAWIRWMLYLQASQTTSELIYPVVYYSNRAGIHKEPKKTTCELKIKWNMSHMYSFCICSVLLVYTVQRNTASSQHKSTCFFIEIFPPPRYQPPHRVVLAVELIVCSLDWPPVLGKLSVPIRLTGGEINTVINDENLLVVLPAEVWKQPNNIPRGTSI